MDSKNLNKKEKQKKKDRLALMLCIGCTAAVLIVMFAMIISSKKTINKNNGGNSNNNSNNEQTSEGVDMEAVNNAQVDPEMLKYYSAGLKEDGSLKVDSNLLVRGSDTLLSNLEYFEDDFEMEVSHGQIIHRVDYVIGDYLLKNIALNAEVEVLNVGENYYDQIKELLQYIIEHDFKLYTDHYENANKETWDDIYEFLKTDEKQYDYYISSKAMEQYQYNLVCDILIKQFGITVTEDDMVDYILNSDAKVKGKTDALIMIKQLGKSYVAQKTAINKLKYVLYEKAEKREGGMKNNNDTAKPYDSLFTENGKIKDMGKISSYVILPENIKEVVSEAKNLDEMWSLLKANTEIKEHENFKNAVMSLTDKDLDTDELKIAFYEDSMLAQAIIEKYSASISNYEYEYLMQNSYDYFYRDVVVANYGLGYYNSIITQFAAKRVLSIETDLY